ncbi:MAG: GDP-L-fucose synthase [Patescibacteria group bacterium]
MEKNSKIYVAGHRGLAGSAIVRKLIAEGFTNLVLKTRSELDLLDQKAVAQFFEKEKPEFVFLAAAKVGGIMANNTHPAEFIYENLVVQTNVLHAAQKNNVQKLVFLGSSCIYPRLAPQPIKEEYFLSGPLEPTNEAYAVAKIAGIVTCQAYRTEYGSNFISIMPTNLYGPNDNFDLENSHVLQGLIRRFHEAKESGAQTITLWGTGTARRELLQVDDFATAALFLMQNYNSGEIINVGTGTDISIKELAESVKKIVGFSGEILWDTTKPDGMPRKLLDVSKIHKLGWKHSVALEDGIHDTYEWYVKNVK